jgi:hypothetical protein
METNWQILLVEDDEVAARSLMDGLGKKSFGALQRSSFDCTRWL